MIEFPGPMTVRDAERLTERIRIVAAATRDNIEKLRDLIDRARDGEVDE